MSDAAVVLLLFEAVKLSGRDGDAPASERAKGTRRRRTAKT